MLRGYQVTDIVRDISKIEMKKDNLKVSKVDGFDEKSISKAIEGNDIVISALGSKHMEKSTLIDATKILIHALKKGGVRPFLSMGGAESLIVDEEGNSHISLEDFAFAMLEEAEKPKFPRKRFTVGY